MSSTLSKKYQIVVPKDVRKRMGLRAGEEVSLHAIDGEKAMLMKHPANVTKALRGLGKNLWRSLGGTEKYIKQERASWQE